MLAQLDFQGKAVLVTGAAAGLGRVVALTLAGFGADLCLVDVNAEGLAATANDAGGRGVEIVVADLSRAENCALAVERAVARFGRLDGVCNVAGVAKFMPFTEIPIEQFELTMAVNFAAPFFLSQAAIPHLLATSGAIVNVASAAAFVGEAYLAPYAASKAALVSLTKSLAMEYAKTSIRVSAVAPGGMETGMAAGMGGASLPAGIDFTLVERYVPLRGLVSVKDVAMMIAWLASEQGGAFHGGCVHMDAGITAG